MGAVEPVAAAVTVLVVAVTSLRDLDQRPAPIGGTITSTDPSEAVAGGGDGNGIGSYALVSNADARVIALEYRPDREPQILQQSAFVCSGCPGH